MFPTFKRTETFFNKIEEQLSHLEGNIEFLIGESGSFSNFLEKLNNAEDKNEAKALLARALLELERLKYRVVGRDFEESKINHIYEQLIAIQSSIKSSK